MRDEWDDYSPSISLSDLMLKVLFSFFVMWLSLAVQEKLKKADGIQKKAEVFVTAEWDRERSPTIDCDVDLWVRAPTGDVSYFNTKEYPFMNLERDDLGDKNDRFVNSMGQMRVVNEDKEYWYLRQVVPGEYTVNLHLYSCVSSTGVDKGAPRNLPVEVRVVDLNPTMNIVYSSTVVIRRVDDEVTAVNFNLSADGTVTGTTVVPVRMIQSTTGGPQ